VGREYKKYEIINVRIKRNWCGICRVDEFFLAT